MNYELREMVYDTLQVLHPEEKSLILYMLFKDYMEVDNVDIVKAIKDTIDGYIGSNEIDKRLEYRSEGY